MSNSGSLGILEKTDTSIVLELWPRTFQNEERYERLLEEVKLKYNLKEVNVVLGRSQTNPKKLTLTFKI